MRAVKEFGKGFLRGMKLFGNNITAIVNTVLLSIVYIIGVGATAIVAKLVGKRFLRTKLDKKSKTYWEDMNAKKRPLEEHYRQF